MSRVLVTGGAGFIGHHVVEHFLKNTDWEIIIMDRMSRVGTLHRLTDISIWEAEKDRVRYIWHDLRSPLNPFVLCCLGKVLHIFHLAASTHVDRSIIDPISFVYDNEIGTCNMLMAARKILDGGFFFNFSTDEVFGSAPENYNYKEDDRWRPSNPYSASKVGAAAMGYAFYVTYGLPVITTFAMNNFGERQHPEKFIPIIIRSILSHQEIPIHSKIDGEGNVLEIGSRFWLHCRNTASALLFLCEHGWSGDFYNIVGDVELSNLALVKEIGDILGETPRIRFVDFHKVRPGHDRRYALDGAKMKEMGWSPPVDFHTSLKKTVLWTLDHKEWLL